MPLAQVRPGPGAGRRRTGGCSHVRESGVPALPRVRRKSGIRRWWDWSWQPGQSVSDVAAWGLSFCSLHQYRGNPDLVPFNGPASFYQFLGWALNPQDTVPERFLEGCGRLPKGSSARKSPLRALRVVESCGWNGRGNCREKKSAIPPRNPGRQMGILPPDTGATDFFRPDLPETPARVGLDPGRTYR